MQKNDSLDYAKGLLDEEIKIKRYALQYLRNQNQDKDIQYVLYGDGLNIILKSGLSLRLSEEEIKERAADYLRSEIEMINSH
jgi:hypothetical protein